MDSSDYHGETARRDILLMGLIMHFAMRCYGLAIAMASLFSHKAKLWISGRKNLFARLESLDSSKSWVWIHVASLGEFEQGRPLIELLRAQHPSIGLLLTFFSPSGYLPRQNYGVVDHVDYIPLDVPENAERFVSIMRPVLAIFVKYDVWYHHLRALEQSGAPTLLVSARMRRGQYFLKWYGRFMRNRLAAMQHIFVQDDTSEQLLGQHGIRQVSVCGDLRVDRVLQIASQEQTFPWKDQLAGKTIIVAGSTWPQDERVLLSAASSLGAALIIAPHEVHATRISMLETQVEGKAGRLSALDPSVTYDVIIVDNIGQLASLYRLADVAYVGGGFGTGIHNILEAAVYGVPVVFGPRHDKFQEAHDLLLLGVAFTIREADDFVRVIQSMDSLRLQEIRNKLTTYFASHRGATQQVYDYIRRAKLLAE